MRIRNWTDKKTKTGLREWSNYNGWMRNQSDWCCSNNKSTIWTTLLVVAGEEEPKWTMPEAQLTTLGQKGRISPAILKYR